jgi:hypothetical protein
MQVWCVLTTLFGKIIMYSMLSSFPANDKNPGIIFSQTEKFCKSIVIINVEAISAGLEICAGKDRVQNSFYTNLLYLKIEIFYKRLQRSGDTALRS